MAPVPPRQFLHALGDGGGKSRTDHPRRVSGDDGIGRHVFRHDRAGGDHRPSADLAAGKDDGAMADPDIVADLDMMRPPPVEEFSIIHLAGEIRARAISKMGLRDACHRVVARIDPGHGRDRAEFSEGRVGGVAVVDDVGIIRELDLEQFGARADLRIGSKLAGVDRRRRMHAWREREILGGHCVRSPRSARSGRPQSG